MLLTTMRLKFTPFLLLLPFSLFLSAKATISNEGKKTWKFI